MDHYWQSVALLVCLIVGSNAQPPVAGAVFTRSYSQVLSNYEYSKYSGQSGTSTPYFISQLNFDSIPGSIAVGAADWLYVLNLNLTMAKQVNLPPQASTSACSAAIGYNADYVCRNHLRVFTSSPTDPTRLVVCGSEAIGTPSCRAVNDKNRYSCSSHQNNTRSFTSVTAANGMVSIRPDFYGSGIAYNVNNPRGINFFSVSTLNLNANNTGLFFLTVNYTNPTDPNSLYTVLQLRTNSIANFKTPVFVDTYRANYAPRTALLPGVMDTISPDEHKYFYVFVRDTDSTNKVISQLVRVCQNDPGNSGDDAPLTLVKARINCNSATYSTNYNAISGVAFNQMGRYYQNGDWSLFMYGVFTTTIGGVTLSAVCVYPANNSVEDSTGRFGRNGGVFDIFRTLLVNPNTGTQTTSGYVECTANGNLARPDYTYTDTVLPIAQIGTEPLAVLNGVTVTKIVLDQTCVVTSTAQTCVIQDVLFLGTAAGTVLKVASGFTSGSIISIVSEEIKLDDTSSVRQISIQQQGGVKYLYVNTDTSIYRLPVQRCGRYLSCSTCVGSRDPYCVWNTSLSQCVVTSIVPTINGASATVPNGIYQNIHTGVVNSCPALTLSVSNSLLGTSQPAFSGSNITFVCTANDGHNGATVTSYQWYKNGVALNNGGTIQSILSVSSVTLQDQGTYQCNAINVEGSSSSLSNGIQLTVIDVMVTSQPQNLTNVLPGRMANFSVTAAGAESFTFQWQYGNGTNIPPGGRYQGVTTPTLVISPVIGGDNSSAYVCRVTSPSGNTTTTQPAYLMLASNPVLTQQPTATLSVTFGQDAALSCSANGLGPLIVRWTTPPGITPPQSRQYGGYDITDTLVLSSVNTTHRGTYMCVVTDSRGTEVSSMPSILRVIVPTPNAVAVVNSLLGTFSCITNDGVGGATITSYQWVKNGVALSNGGRVTGANQPTLSISNVMPQDQGLYQCNVTNVDGITSLSAGTTLLFVATTPVFTTSPTDSAEAFGGTTTFSCTAVGLGTLTITWNTTSLLSLPPPTLVQSSPYTAVSTLSLGPLSVAHRGQYWCTVADSTGRVAVSNMATLGIIVPTPNAITLASLFLGMFSCTSNDGVGGATITSYQWVKNGVALSNGGNVKGANQPTLSISNVMPQDQGLYQCNVTNVDGDTVLSAGTTLLFVDPTIVTQPSSQVVLPGSTAVFSIGAVSVVSSGGGSISYMWTYSNGSQLAGDRFQGTNTSTLTISPVLVSDNGSSFICTVTGSSGIVEISQIASLISSLCVKVKCIAHSFSFLSIATTPVFTTSPTDSAEAFGGTTTFSCTAVGLGTLTITWNTTSLLSLPPPTLVLSSPYTAVSTLSLGPLSVAHRGQYWCTVADSSGRVAVSNMATLGIIVPTPNAITLASLFLGMFSCTSNDGVGGATITSYQWVKNGVALSNGGRVTGANQPTLSISNVMPQDQGLYQCNVTNVDGVTSLSAGTTLLAIDPAIVTQPSSQVVLPGSTAAFSIGAVSVVSSGGGSISYVWTYSNGSQLAGDRFQGTNTSTLTISPVLGSDNGSSFICTVSGSLGVYVTSQPVSLMLAITPAFGTSPTSRTKAIGGTTTFSSTGRMAVSNLATLGIDETPVVIPTSSSNPGTSSIGISPQESLIVSSPAVSLSAPAIYGIFGALAALIVILLAVLLGMCCCTRRRDGKEMRPADNNMKELTYNMTNLMAIEMMEETDGSTVTSHPKTSEAADMPMSTSGAADMPMSTSGAAGMPMSTSDVLPLKGEEAVTPQSKDDAQPAGMPSLNATAEPTIASVLAASEECNAVKTESKLERSTDSDVTTKL
eukprot:Em0024g182a